MGVKRRTSVYFAAGAIETLVSVAVLPFTTQILGPTAYGLFALVTTFTWVGVTVATLGTSFVISAQIPVINKDERRELLSTLTAYMLTVTAVFVVIVLGAFSLLTRIAPELQELSGTGYFLALGTMMLAPLWLLASEVTAVEGRATAYAIVMVAQMVFRLSALLVALFVFDAGVISLFVGTFVGASVQAIGAIYVMGSDIRLRISSRWIKEVWRLVAQTGLANVMQVVYNVAERSLLSAHAGLATLGLYSHSQRYRSVGELAAKSLQRGSWPVSLDEARDLSGKFQTTGRVWRGGHVLLTLAGISAATVGDYVIALLTHDKFTESYTYVAIWMIVVLLANTGRAQQAAFYALDRGNELSRLVSISVGVSIAAIFLLVPSFGVGGVLATVVLQTLVTRVLMQVVGRRFRSFPFQDTWALAGIAFIVAVLLIKISLHPTFAGSVLLLFGFSIAWIAVGSRPLLDVWRTLRRDKRVAHSSES